MRRNSGLIGPFKGISKTNGSGSGIHDTFDNYNARVLNKWPTVLKIEYVSYSSGTQSENTVYSHSVTSNGLVSTETLYWKIVHGTTTSTDFYLGIVQGTFTQTASTQTGTFDVEHDFIGDPNKSTRTYSFQILRGGYSGDVLYESGTITIQKPILGNFSWTPSALNEGISSNLSFYLGTGTSRSRTFTLTNTGSASAADFNGGLPLSRAQNPNSPTNVAYTTVEDLVTEGSETLTVAISYGSYAAWGSTTLTIVDTSVYPSISSVTPSTTNITEGNTVTFTVTDSTGSGGTLYWTINTSGGVSAADFSPPTLSGSFALTSGSGTIDISPIAEGSAEGETFTLEIRYGSTSGTILATSTAVTITDAAAPAGTDITTSFYEISNRFIDSQVYMSGSAADYTGPYDVGEVQFDFNGTGNIYIVVKFTSSVSYYNDVPIGGIQVLNSSKTAILHEFIFYNITGGTGSSWTTTTSSPAGLQSSSGLYFTPATASGYSYSSIASGTTANRMNWATGTGSSFTGAADGISSGWSTSILPLGDATVSQSGGAYYMYCETSGATTNHVCVARSPSISLTAGSWIRIAHALTAPTGNPMDPNDTLWVGIY